MTRNRVLKIEQDQIEVRDFVNFDSFTSIFELVQIFVIRFHVKMGIFLGFSYVVDKFMLVTVGYWYDMNFFHIGSGIMIANE